MPQMSPMNWLALMIMFTLILILCISLMYFTYMPMKFNQKVNNYDKKITKTLNWKW
uniref:ATP synthase complex subunit 8 n=1 Tax=Trachelus tabidus TaxID=1001291 RepID=A0A1J0KFH1_9HYME|nr:ATP synthase F0 subunit 8 [Trachelus tabidus]APC92677.1 ATP synthase F0 subunit 8 [Trachelus tabidus]